MRTLKWTRAGLAAIAVALIWAPAPVRASERPAHAEPEPQPGRTLDRRIASAADGVALATTIYLPSGPGPFPAIVIAHGANPGSRNRPGWRSTFAPVLDAGIAIAVADPRGVGDTPGEWGESPPLNVSAQDISTIVDALGREPLIRADRIGVWGASRGGWTGPMAAVRNERIRFVALVSAPSVSPNESDIYQRGQELIDRGFRPDEVEEINAFRRVVWNYYGTGQGYEAARAAWRDARSKPWFARIGLTRADPVTPDRLSGPNFQYYREGAYDPTPTLTALQAPTLVILGNGDRHIPVEASLANWRAAFEASGNADAAVMVLSRAGHGMQLTGDAEAMTAVEGQARPRATALHPAYMPLLVAWLLHQVR